MKQDLEKKLITTIQLLETMSKRSLRSYNQTLKMKRSLIKEIRFNYEEEKDKEFSGTEA